MSSPSTLPRPVSCALAAVLALACGLVEAAAQGNPLANREFLLTRQFILTGVEDPNPVITEFAADTIGFFFDQTLVPYQTTPVSPTRVDLAGQNQALVIWLPSYIYELEVVRSRWFSGQARRDGPLWALEGVAFSLYTATFEWDYLTSFSLGPLLVGADAFRWQGEEVPAPPNDDFADRIVLSGYPVSALADLTGAGIEPAPVEYGYDTVWYNWVAPVTGRVLFELSRTENSEENFNPVLEVFTGSSLNTLLVVGGAQAFIDRPAQVLVDVEAGFPYQIRILNRTGENTLMRECFLEIRPE